MTPPDTTPAAMSPAAMGPADELAGIQGIAYMDGRYMPLAEASVPVLDRGFLRSDITYDALHVWKGRFFRLHDHIARFQASMAGLRMSLPHSGQDIADILTECVRRTGWRDAFVMVMCSRGVPPVGVRDPRLCRNRLYAYVQPFARIADATQQRDGLSMILARTQRIASAALDQRIKNFHWLDLTMSLFEAYEQDAALTVLPSAEGTITEGPGFNVFVVKDGALATPDHGMFEGITRRTAMEIAASLQLRCEARPVRTEELETADELFISTTAGGITPVTRYNGRPVGDGRPGPVASRIHDLYWARHDDDALNTAIDYGTP